jgi:lipopolysaccharide biosynthesis glycosyltransferase
MEMAQPTPRRANNEHGPITLLTRAAPARLRSRQRRWAKKYEHALAAGEIPSVTYVAGATPQSLPVQLGLLKTSMFSLLMASHGPLRINLVLNSFLFTKVHLLIGELTAGDALSCVDFNLLGGKDFMKLTVELNRMLASSKYHTSHYSAAFTLLKLFIPHVFSNIANVIEPATVFIDSDTVFLDDVQKFWKSIKKSGLLGKSALVGVIAPEDAPRVRSYFTEPNRDHNGDSKLYAQGGVLCFNLLQAQQYRVLLDVSAANMVLEYPDFDSSVADQDIVNRLMHDARDKVAVLPCRWNYDFSSWNESAGQSRTCNQPPGIAHFNLGLGGSQLKALQKNMLEPDYTGLRGARASFFLGYYGVYSALPTVVLRRICAA